MTLDINEGAMLKKLQIVKDDSGEMPWMSRDTTRGFSKQKRVEPFPGICIKTWTESREKVFINICHSKELFPPEDISEERLLKLLEETVPSFVIPMAIGMEKMAKDKEDKERSTFDILVNTDYFKKCMDKRLFLKFTIAAILESINDKYNKNIDVSNYIILKNRKVVGSLSTFNIEDRKPKQPKDTKPLIQVLDSKETNDKSEKPKTEKTKNETQDSVKYKQNQDFTAAEQDLSHNNYVIVMSDNQEKMTGYFYLPSSSITNLVIDIAENRIIVEDQKSGSLIDVFVPHSIDNNLVSAHYDDILHILRITLPLKKN